MRKAMCQGHGLLILQREVHVDFVSGDEFKGRNTSPAGLHLVSPPCKPLSGFLCQFTCAASTAHSELLLEESLKATTRQCRKQESLVVENLHSRPFPGLHLAQCLCRCLHKLFLPLQMSAITRKTTNQKKVLQLTVCQCIRYD